MRDETGFSLIELLSTLAIVGILSAIAVGNFSEYKKHAYDVQAISQVRSMQTSLEAFLIDSPDFTVNANGLVSITRPDGSTIIDFGGGTVSGGVELLDPIFSGYQHQEGVGIFTGHAVLGYVIGACHELGSKGYTVTQNEGSINPTSLISLCR